MLGWYTRLPKTSMNITSTNSPRALIPQSRSVPKGFFMNVFFVTECRVVSEVSQQLMRLHDIFMTLFDDFMTLSAHARACHSMSQTVSRCHKMSQHAMQHRKSSWQSMTLYDRDRLPKKSPLGEGRQSPRNKTCSRNCSQTMEGLGQIKVFQAWYVNHEFDQGGIKGANSHPNSLRTVGHQKFCTNMWY